LQHQKGHLSEKTIRLSVGSVSVDVLKKFDQDEKGDFFNNRMDQEMIKRTQYLDSRYFNGKKGGRPIKANSKANSKPNNKAKQNLPENRNINEDLNNIINVSFEDFWNSYDKKRGDKTKLEAKWNSLNNDERNKIMEYIPKYKQATPDKIFRKDPQTFFNNKSWNDEIIINNSRIWGQKTNKSIIQGSSKYLNQ
jgi:hypothetical protein